MEDEFNMSMKDIINNLKDYIKKETDSKIDNHTIMLMDIYNILNSMDFYNYDLYNKKMVEYIKNVLKRYE